MSEFFLASLEFHPIFVGVKVKGELKKILINSRQYGCLISIGKRRDVYGHLFGEILLYLM